MQATYSGKWRWLKAVVEADTSRISLPGQRQFCAQGRGARAFFLPGSGSRHQRQPSGSSLPTAVTSRTFTPAEERSSSHLASYDLTPLSSHWFRACILSRRPMARLASSKGEGGLRSSGHLGHRSSFVSQSGIFTEASSLGKSSFTCVRGRLRPSGPFFLQERRKALSECSIHSRLRAGLSRPGDDCSQSPFTSALVWSNQQAVHKCLSMSNTTSVSRPAVHGAMLPPWAARSISTRRRRYFKMRKFHKKKYKKKLMRIKKIPFVEMHKEKKTWKTYRETRMFYKEFRRGPPKKGARKLRLKRER
ncbi:hypothetical protein CSUI_006821 [Cystoisospora suis]|uniref:Uncharacterized protein n=1 Tax=Cystoisospora suis TaxID=483139 RepID=A0A2C6KP84_9APIC|nr:hypothetical protein CSUI_006821 [Cystoisospora suis]